MRVADDPAHAFQRGQFLWSALRITAGGDELCPGIGLVDCSKGLSRLRIGRSGDGASVHNHDVSHLARARAKETASEELKLDRRGIGLGGPAAEIHNVKRSHEAD